MDISPLAERKVDALGPAGESWLASLPALVDELQRKWEIVVGASIMGGSAGYVAAATTAAGEEAILKIAMPDGLDGQGEFACELRAVRLGQGRGYVRLLQSDERRRAMLQERLGRPLAACGRTVPDQLDVIAETLAPSWQRDPGPYDWWTGARQADALASAVCNDWETCGRPCPDRVIEQATKYAQRRRDAYAAADAVVIHGDAHPNNVLEDRNGGFKVIDPDAMLSHREHDLAIPIRDWCDELLRERDPAAHVRRWCRYVSDVCGADDQAVFEWAFVERVSTGLFMLRLGDEGGRKFLAIADAIAQG